MLQKYFIAIIPSEPVYTEIETIKKTVSEKYNNKSALKSPPHITLHMPFEWKTEKETILLEALNKFTLNASFSVELKNYGFFEPKVVFIDVVKNSELQNLQNNLVQHIKVNLNIFNQADDKLGFHPHITIAFRDLKKQAFYDMKEEYRKKGFSSTFTVSSFWLLKHNGRFWEPFHEFFIGN